VGNNVSGGRVKPEKKVLDEILGYVFYKFDGRTKPWNPCSFYY
jgi:hypothetical protein